MRGMILYSSHTSCGLRNRYVDSLPFFPTRSCAEWRQGLPNARARFKAVEIPDRMLGGAVLSGGHTDVPKTRRRKIRVGLLDLSLGKPADLLHVCICTHYVFVDRCGREYCKWKEQLLRVPFKPKEY